MTVVSSLRLGSVSSGVVCVSFRPVPDSSLGSVPSLSSSLFLSRTSSLPSASVVVAAASSGLFGSSMIAISEFSAIARWLFVRSILDCLSVSVPPSGLCRWESLG